MRPIVEQLQARTMLSADPEGATNVPLVLPPQHDLQNLTGYLTAKTAGSPLVVAKAYLAKNAKQLGVSAADLASALVTDQYTDADSGITHIYLRQTYQGIEISNANLVVNVASQGRVINVGGGFTSLPAAAKWTGTLGAIDALKRAAPTLGLKLRNSPVDVTPVPKTPSANAAARRVLQAKDVARSNIPAAMEYFWTPGGLRPTWNLQVDTLDKAHWYSTNVEADTGEVVFSNDWVDQASYNVMQLPNESANEGSRAVVTNPADPLYSPFGWHDTNGVAGAEYTVTRGNNVYAYTDTTATNTPGFSPDGTASLDFNFPWDTTVSPSSGTNQSAAVTNLFYLNNYLHDLHARYGFTEAAGNFETTNYSGAGAGNDAVLAEAQDGSGTNNANFATPPDGSAPRMQMYLFTKTTPSRDGDLDDGIVIHEYGHGVTNRLTGGPANANALTALQSSGMGEGWGDWWALMLTQRPTDLQSAAYPMGTWALGQLPTGPGIRRYPYSYDMSVNPQTFSMYGSLGTEVHNTGELWATALWDMNWLLIQKYGFESNILGGYDRNAPSQDGGNQLALQLVMNALKLQPANPSFIDARNAIIAADVALNGGQDLFEIWSAFARRGLGASATTASSSATTVTTATDLPITLLKPSVLSQSPSVPQTTALSSVSITFSKAMDPTSFSIVDDIASFTGPGGADLRAQVTGFTWLNGNATLQIDFAPQSVNGRYSIVIGPQILAASDASPMDQDHDGTGGEAIQDQYTASLAFDAVPLQVTGTSAADGSVVNVPFTTIDVHVNEAIDPATVGTNDLTLSSGAVTAAALLDSTTVRYTLSGLTAEGTLTMSVAAGAIADASGFGNVAFTETIGLDIGTRAMPAFVSVAPRGSLVYQSTGTGTIGAPSDTDAFTVAIDAGQTLAVFLHPTTATLRGRISVLDPSGATIASALATAANVDAVLRMPGTTIAGTYTIVVSSDGVTAGAYAVTASLNAAYENEEHGGATNDTSASAESIGAPTPLGNGAAVTSTIGALPPTAGITVASDDFETGTLGPKWSTYSSDALGRIQISGASGTGGGLYAMLMDRNDSVGSAYTLNEAIWTVNLSGLSAATLSFSQASYSDENDALALDFAGHANGDGVSISADGVNWHRVWQPTTTSTAYTPVTLDLAAAATAAGMTLNSSFKIKFQQYDNYNISTDGRGFDSIVVSTPASNADYYSTSLLAGQHLAATLGKIGGAGTGVIRLYDAAATLLATSTSTATNVVASIADFVAPADGVYYVSVTGNDLGYNLTTSLGAALDVEPNNATPTPLNGRTVAVGGLDTASDEDRYSITFLAGQTLGLRTRTPSDGAGEFGNTLDPVISIYDASGTLLGTDDNGAGDGHNASLSFTAPAAGTYTIRVSAALGTSGEYVLTTGDSLAISAPANVNETDGTLTATIIATQAPTSDLTITLTSSDPTRVSVPTTVILPADQTSVTVPLSVIDNNLLDGRQTISLTATAAGFIAGLRPVIVHDDETAALTITLPGNAVEGGSALQGTITASAAPSRDIVVSLQSSIPGRLTVPATVTLLAGHTSVSFTATVPENTLLDGTQTIAVNATNENWTTGTAIVAVADNDATLSITIPASGWEGQTLTGLGTVRIGGTLSSNLVVSLLSNDTSELSVPATVTILAGQTSATFSLSLLADALKDGSQTVSVSASAANLANASASIVVHDADLDHLSIDPITGTKTAGTVFPISAHAFNIANEQIATYASSGTLSATRQSGASVTVAPTGATFAAGAWTGNVTLTQVDPAITLSLTSGTAAAASNPFAVQAGAASSFTFGPVASPQIAGIPFAATATAKDAYGNLATGFNGNVALSGLVGSTVPMTMLTSPPSQTSANNGTYTMGFAFTPNTNLELTSVLSYFGSKVSIWTNTGTLIATQPVTGAGGAWTETPLATHVFLTAGTTYRITSYSNAQLYYWRTTAHPNPSFATLGQNYEIASDAFPTGNSGATQFWLVDFRANVGAYTSVPLAATSATFVNGLWTGDVNVLQGASGMHLHLADTGSHIGDSNDFDVLQRTLSFSLPSDVREDDGNLTGILNVSPLSATDLVVTLTSSDPTRVTVPTTVTVPAGQSFVEFPIGVLDNALLDGAEAITFTATLAGYPTTTSVITVHDNETGAVSVTLPAQATEGDAVAMGTVTLTAASAQDTIVKLLSSNPGRATVPATITIPAGQTTGTFALTVVDNASIDGTAIVSVSAAIDNWITGYRSIRILDNDNALTLTLPPSGWEGQTLTGLGTVRIGGTLSGNLVVSLLADDATELTAPATVTILAGQTSATFSLALLADSLNDGSQTVNLSASAVGVANASASIVVHDADLDHLGIDPITGVKTAGTAFPVTAHAFNIVNEPIATYAGSGALLATRQSGAGVAVTPGSATFVAGNWTVNVTFTSADPAITLSFYDRMLSASSNAFAVQAGAASSFTFGPVASPQIAGTSFAATAAAKDAYGNLATSFNGNVALSGLVGSTVPMTMLGSLPSQSSTNNGTYTLGYAFTPNTTLELTSVLSYYGSKVSIWTNTGTLIATQAVSGPNGAWSETPLATHVTLTAGTTYRIASYSNAQTYYWRTAAPTNPTFATIGPVYNSTGDAFPTSSTSSTAFWLVDFRANVGSFVNVPLAGTNAAFVNGLWAGNVTVNQAAAGMHLHLADASNHLGDSSTFDVLSTSEVPSMPVLSATSDTGVSSSDQLTRLNNADASSRLAFTVQNTVAGATVSLFADGVLIGTGTATGTSTTIVTDGSTLLADGAHLFTTQQTEPGHAASVVSAPVTVTLDTIGPTMTVAPTFNFSTFPMSVGFTTSEQVASNGLTVVGSAGQVLTTTGFAADGRATIGFAAYTATALPDGRYVMTIPAGALFDLAGNPMAGGEITLDFFALAGDFNRDGVVDFTDLLTLAKNYGTTSKTFSQGDATLDGAIDFTDLLVVAKHYGWTPDGPSVPPNAAPVTLPVTTVPTDRNRAVRGTVANDIFRG